MPLCDKYNLSIAIYSVFWNNYLYVNENNEIVGKFGKAMSSMLQPNPRSLCKFHNQEHAGKKLANSSIYDGAIGQIQSNQIDLFIRPVAPFLEPGFVGFTPTIGYENYQIAHAINEKKADLAFQRMLLLNSMDIFYLIYVGSILILFLCVTTLIFYLREKYSLRQEASFLSSFKLLLDTLMNANRIFDQTSIIHLFFVIYLFLTQQFFLIQIKTTKVVVDTSDLITDELSLFRSPKMAAWFEGERELYLTESSPNNTFLGNLYRLKNEDPPLVVPKRFASSTIDFLKRIFLFSASTLLTVVIRDLADIFPLEYFLNVKSFYSVYNVMYRKKEKSAKMDFVDQICTGFYESGILMQTMERIKYAKLYDVPKSFGKIYYDLESIILDNTLYEAINYDNFFYIFIAYIALLFAILIIFLIFKLVAAFSPSTLKPTNGTEPETFDDGRSLRRKKMGESKARISERYFLKNYRWRN